MLGSRDMVVNKNHTVHVFMSLQSSGEGKQINKIIVFVGDSTTGKGQHAMRTQSGGS